MMSRLYARCKAQTVSFYIFLGVEKESGKAKHIRQRERVKPPTVPARKDRLYDERIDATITPMPCHAVQRDSFQYGPFCDSSLAVISSSGILARLIRSFFGEKIVSVGTTDNLLVSWMGVHALLETNILAMLHDVLIGA